MEPTEPALFYTGLVAEMYAALRGADPDPDVYARWISRTGQPALELGCGDGDPLLALRAMGLQVEGLDSAGDMLDRCRRRAGELGLDVTLHHSRIEEMDLGRTYPSIYLAGPTFNLIADDDTAGRALRRIAAHLTPTGAALIPLFIPPAPEPGRSGRAAERTQADGTVVRFATVAQRRDEMMRVQRAVLHYERVRGDDVAVVEREWVLHWHTQTGFRRLAEDAGLHVRAVLDTAGRPAAGTADEFVFIVALERGDAPNA